MKFTCTVEIDAPIDKVIKLFEDPDSLKEWQDGFLGIEHISETEGEVGAKSKMRYKIGKREIELIETIQVYNLPEEYTAVYEAKQMVNTMSNHFTAIDDSHTKYVAHIEYTKFNGFMIKLMATLMPGMFKKQTQKWLDQFKAFVERS